MKSLVIIPAFNEEKSIDRVLHSIKRWSPEVDICVVNDGSTDGTSRVAKATGLAHVVDLPVNLGIGGAVQTGYLYAYQNHYDIAIQIDADGQHDPADLRNVIETVASGEADCCVGSRFVEHTEYIPSFFRGAGIRFFSWMIRMTVGKRIFDPTSGFRAVNRQVIEVFANYYPDDYPEVEALVLLSRKGFITKEISVKMQTRAEGKSSITPLKSIYYMIKVSLAVVMTRIRNVS
ncbi:glycosyltransferase family 2 protein [Gorillibacterium massiliense]|uniref:glycosyltransferase family 2 protein n=1 Tax=Gorillibacterium massiliense TaxID=1280390 RepID=UPI0004BC22C0|nr:glycosyltransferase family 2 protein [Gorillibacterium massiliense]